MVTRSLARSTNSFGAIADPTRRAILDSLRGGECSAGDLANQFPVSRPAVSRHVRILKRAGLIQERRHRRSRYYSLDGRALAQVDQWLAPYRLFWGARLQDILLGQAGGEGQ
ncbi:MAG TPA: metalloregulator ArsR/SmtB family transcription factor [Steroidobacteraceae bacterium]